jgi:hypothetical protein
LAIDAESRQLRRADFFWREAIRQLEVLWRDDAVGAKPSPINRFTRMVRAQR